MKVLYCNLSLTLLCFKRLVLLLKQDDEFNVSNAQSDTDSRGLTRHSFLQDIQILD